jgi:hypothetical protein
VTIGQLADGTLPVRLVAMARCVRVTKGITMTIDALPGKARRSSRSRRSGSPPLAIGEVDANIVPCPACSRPLDAGASKCPDCGMRMIAGVRASRALGLMASGLVVGLIIGTSVTGAAAILTRPGEVTAVTPVASAAALPSAAVPASAAPVVVSAIPSEAISAIRQSAELNQRLAADAARLQAALAAAAPATSDLAPILRSLSANAAFGERVSPKVATWSAAAALSTNLTTLYGAVGRTAREGLSASLRNTAAYVKASRAMLTVLGGLVALDAQARPLADEADLVLAPLTLSGETAP